MRDLEVVYSLYILSFRIVTQAIKLRVPYFVVVKSLSPAILMILYFLINVGYRSVGCNHIGFDSKLQFN